MNSVQRDVLEKTTLLALEEWGLMLCDRSEEVAEHYFADVSGLLLASMRFQGILKGQIYVLVQEAFSEALCRNLLAKESEEAVSHDEKEDVLRELCNVILGNYLTEAYGDDTVFELTLPMVRAISGSDLERFFNNDLQLAVIADDQPLAVAVGPLEEV